MHNLPCHFIWNDGRTSATLDDLLADADDRREETAWHLDEGHLQEALVDQGYQQMIVELETISDPGERVEVLLERLAIYHAMYRRWQVASEFGGYIGRIKKLFRKGKATLLPSVPAQLCAALGDLSTAVCGVEGACTPGDDEYQPSESTTTKVKDSAKKAAKKTAKKVAKETKKVTKKIKKAEAATRKRIAKETKRIAKATKDNRALQA